MHKQHILIRSNTQELKLTYGSGLMAVVPSLMLNGMAAYVADIAISGEVAVYAMGEIPGGAGTYRDAMLRKLEGVRHRLAEVEDSSRARGERLLEAAKDNGRLRAEVEEHLRTIDGQKDMIAGYLVRVAELETEVT